MLKQIKDFPTRDVADDNDLLIMQDHVTGETYNIKEADFLADLSSSGNAPPNNTSLLCHFTGINNSTIFVDEKGHTLSVYGNTKISTSEFKFGASSGYFDGSSDYIDIALDSTLALASSDFTLEAWVKPASVSGTEMVLSSTPATGQVGYSIAIDNGFLRFESGGGNPGISSSKSLSADLWNHVAICRSGNNYYFSVNGTTQIITNTTSWSDSSILRIGANGRLDYPYYFSGYIDELRITKGQALYTSDFLVPTTAFAN